MDLESARKIWRSWNYEPPSDPEEFRRHAKNASRYEHGMRLLNSRLADEEIDHDAFHDAEMQLYMEIYCPELLDKD